MFAKGRQYMLVPHAPMCTQSGVAVHVAFGSHVDPIRYVESVGGYSIAYQVVGDGPLDIVFVHGWVCSFQPRLGVAGAGVVLSAARPGWGG